MNLAGFLYLLLEAISHNNLKEVVKLCEQINLKNLKDSFIPNPLNLALRVASINPEIVQTLLKHSMQPSSEDMEIYATLPDTIKQSLPQLPDIPLRSNSTIDWFQKVSLTVKDFVRLYETNYKKGAISLARYLVSMFPKMSKAEKESLLVIAATLGDAEFFETLLNDPEINPERPYLLYRTDEFYRHPNIVEILLKNGRVNPAIFSNEPLYKAVTARRLAVVKLLLKDKRVTSDIYSACHSAIVYGHTEIVKAFFEHNIDFSSWDKQYLDTAVKYSHFDIAKFLLKETDVIKKLHPLHCFQIIDLAITKSDLDFIKARLENEDLISNTELLPHGFNKFKQHPECLKLFLACTPKEAQPDLPEEFTSAHLPQEIAWLRSLFNKEAISLQKRLFNQLQSTTGITLNTKHYLTCAELLYTSQNKEEFSKKLTEYLLKDKEVTRLLKDNLCQFVKAFYPLVATSKQLSKEHPSNPTIPPHLPLIMAATLFPKMPEPLIKGLLKTWQKFLIAPLENHASPLKAAFEELVIAQTKESLQRFATSLYQSKITSPSWVETIQTTSASKAPAI